MTGFPGRSAPSSHSFGVLVLGSVLVGGPGLLIIRSLQPGLVLPAFGVLLLSYAAMAAVGACSIHAARDSEHVTLWDIAGAFAMMGCAAATFSEPDQVTLLYEQLFE